MAELMIKRENPFTAERNASKWFAGLAPEAGWYEEAAKQGQTLTAFLETQKSQKAGQETLYNNLTPKEIVTLRRSMGQKAPQTALMDILNNSGLRAYGAYTHTAEKFFEYSGIDVLFPEWINNNVFSGLMLSSLVSEFAQEVVIDALDYYKIYLQDVEASRQMGIVDELVDLPMKSIAVAKQGVRLQKFGLYALISYEALRFHRLNVFGRAFQTYGLQIGIDMTDEMLYIMQNGDGNSGTTPATTVTTTATGAFNTKDILSWAKAGTGPYRIDKFVGAKAYIIKYLTQLSNFQNPMTQFGFMGVDLPRSYDWDRTSSPFTGDLFLGLDSRFAIEHITTGGIQSESEKIIRKQGQGTSLVHWSNFSINTANATMICDIDH